MAKIRYGKLGNFLAPFGVFLSLLTAISAQPGFLSISCGGETNHTAENNITWVTDSEYINVGRAVDIGNASSYGTYLHSLRFFPMPLIKSCYKLPVTPEVPYVLRLWFAIGVYNGFQNGSSFQISIETQGCREQRRTWAATDVGNDGQQWRAVSSQRELKTTAGKQNQPVSYRTTFQRKVVSVQRAPMQLGADNCPASDAGLTSACHIRRKVTCCQLTPSDMRPINCEDSPPFDLLEAVRRLKSSWYAYGACQINEAWSIEPWTCPIHYVKWLTFLLGKTFNISYGKSIGAWAENVRYPQDQFDRLWLYDSILNTDARSVSSPNVISTSDTEDLPPTAVMQTAWVANSSDIISIAVPSTPQGTKSFLLLYFAEIETLNLSESRSFYVEITGQEQFQATTFLRSETITLVRNHSAVEKTLQPDQIQYNFTVTKAPNSNRPPILNAYEYHWLAYTDRPTNSYDFYALDALKRSFDIKDWISDPCYLVEWEGIGCDNSSSDIRISKLCLSGRNLTGLLPKDMALLTALVNLSLDNNHLMGSLPNFSNLTSLERLYLHNNNLNGTVPAWLSELKNLKELNIQNNNFSGVIPAQLLHNCSLKLNYSGNPYLPMEKRKCTLKNSKNNNWKVVMATTLGGILIIALALIVGVVVYPAKFRRKGVVKESGRVEKGRNPFLYQDSSRINVPNPTNCLAFTLDEMTTATETFSREIGRGGFGSVFFGKLPEGKEIAVKVLSLFSHQGVDEFLNEVDLLSRINHRNLVSLLGYCNETREVMLIYEHMSKGSLRDHLYGPSAENSQLTWKTRLKITLDAAQGLEYLHMGCTHKIIHRDVKTANILLDGNLTGKVADFGLSRMTIDGQATHVTTAVKGTIGYLDPEYYSTQMLTEKSDVYSFGVVLLETICGRPPIDLKVAEEDINIIRWATPYILDEDVGKIREIIDKRLDGRYDMKSMTRVAKVAMRCVQEERSFRPSMTEVVAELKEALKLEDIIASVSVSGEIGIEGEDLVAGKVESSKRKGMEWNDNSSNIPLVGR